jgi:quercetin dioxygenase-like cupin family protein
LLLRRQKTKQKTELMKIINDLRVSALLPARTGGKGAFVTLSVAAALTLLAGAALATPSSNIVSATVVARASFVDPVDLKFKIKEKRQEVLHAPELLETVMQQIIIGPGGTTGWHSHPGPVVVLIKTGELTFYSSEDLTCTPRTYSAGQAFIDPGQGHVHLARNVTGQNVELWATYFDVPVGGAFRIDAPSPGNCGF